MWASMTNRGLRVFVQSDGRTISGLLMQGAEHSAAWLGGEIVQVDLLHHGTAQAMRAAIVAEHESAHDGARWLSCPVTSCIAARAFDAAHQRAAPTYNHTRGDSELTPCPLCVRP